ncbi:hypothetical protein [Nocardia sp. NPDC058480]|uniref:hypothetical protein n=1 Tax=unclassified Nocardia TaxID=2637762 RepID=UPI00364BE19D
MSRSTTTPKDRRGGDGGARVIMLALVLGAHESQIEKNSWRSAPSEGARYLNFLAELGATKDFALVDVERAITGEIDDNNVNLDSPAVAVVDDESVEPLAA